MLRNISVISSRHAMCRQWEYNMKSFISLLAVAFLIFIFTFYVDGEMGVILIAFLVLAPLTSLLFVLNGRKNVKVTFDCDGYVKKGSTLEVRVTVEKSSNLPVAFIDITPEFSAGFDTQPMTHRLSMYTNRRKEYTFTLNAAIGGSAEVSIGSVRSCGFLGFMKLRCQCELPKPKNVGIIPLIPDINSSSALFRTVADLVLTSEDDEDNDTAMLFSANTTLGYEHREYVEGDSLKRINWKLSSKTGKLMVRLDEASSAVQPCIVLDLFRNSADEELHALRSEEKILQSVFGFLTLLIKQGIACTLVYNSPDGSPVAECVDNPEYPAILLLKVLAYKVEKDKRIAASTLVEGSCASIIATTDTSESFGDLLKTVPNIDSTCVIVPDVRTAHKLQVPVWYLDDDNNFKPI